VDEHPAYLAELTYSERGVEVKITKHASREEARVAQRATSGPFACTYLPGEGPTEPRFFADTFTALRYIVGHIVRSGE